MASHPTGLVRLGISALQIVPLAKWGFMSTSRLSRAGGNP